MAGLGSETGGLSSLSDVPGEEYRIIALAAPVQCYLIDSTCTSLSIKMKPGTARPLEVHCQRNASRRVPLLHRIIKLGVSMCWTLCAVASESILQSTKAPTGVHTKEAFKYSKLRSIAKLWTGMNPYARTYHCRRQRGCCQLLRDSDGKHSSEHFSVSQGRSW